MRDGPTLNPLTPPPRTLHQVPHSAPRSINLRRSHALVRPVPVRVPGASIVRPPSMPVSPVDAGVASAPASPPSPSSGGAERAHGRRPLDPRRQSFAYRRLSHNHDHSFPQVSHYGNNTLHRPSLEPVGLSCDELSPGSCHFSPVVAHLLRSPGAR